VRSKTDVGMINEVLCDVIWHNICCLIQESHETRYQNSILGRRSA
jgi:hypothetical protein